MARGDIVRRPDGAWVLRGQPPTGTALGSDDASAVPFAQRRVGVPS
jgi:hypothetical protein